MSTRIEFFFDFSSPYAYLASRRIGELAARHGRAVWWRPMMLGPALAATGGKPLVELPLKGDYARRDLPRTARFMGVPFRWPARFPVVSLAAARAFYWLEDGSPERAVPFAEAVFRAFFVDDRDIADRAVVGELLGEVGSDAAAGLDAIATPAIKERLKAVTDEAVGRGVFGAPFVFVDGEPFWGADRLGQVERWLETGGF
jgi:2-hydroxychromene-2-carboxylate isomerase